jgi:glutamyl-tRNA reductase
MECRVEHLFCFGMNHKSAPLEIRERVHLPKEMITQKLRLLETTFGWKEVFILSTCNRFEMYGFARGKEEVQEGFCLVQDVPPGQGDDLLEKSYLFVEPEVVVSHLMEVTASLDSLIVGETQIASQLKDAMALAQEGGTFGPRIERLCQEALGASKKVRTHTGIGAKTVSISHAAIDLAKKVFGGDLSQSHFVLLGAGDIAEVAAKYAANHNPKKMSILNRSIQKAVSLTEELGQGKAYSLDHLSYLLEDGDILITSTSSKTPLITESFLRSVMAKRPYRPLFICDIAMPRDVEPACGLLEDVYLFVIDDLQQIVYQNQEERRMSVGKAKSFIAESCGAYLAWLGQHKTRPAISHFSRYLDQQIEEELSRTLKKNLSHGFTEDQIQAMDRLFASIKKRLCADAAIAFQKKEEGPQRGETLAWALGELFPKQKDGGS